MNLEELKLHKIGINEEKFGKIFAFVDFGNANYWYEKDRRDWNDKALAGNQKLIIDIIKLADFLSSFSEQKRFYYGWHRRLKSSWHIVIKAEKNGFVKITKPIQFIRHYLNDEELSNIKTRLIREDIHGKFIEIPKSNFDVEISVDSIRLLGKYDTFCLLSGDSDFAHLVKYLKKCGKKIIIIAPGKLFHTLKENADLLINSQQIKSFIASIK
ncbi:NYN domain-containing protein [Patescibacteria group bacterium]|nr:NYN domain-containing protein [Patescibacteria group bacterium]MBU4162001.1 NYN domain-containing protein [Patescibacteria group bacterium]